MNRAPEVAEMIYQTMAERDRSYAIEQTRVETH
ncbi:hypothetical protein RHAB21_01147 [Pseudorhizobium halotolerans]|uniref:Uncharacterized protein n=1 Tax=Pseudorhizobium halotolerans TaxID=1233081 RepID=A0ABM8Q044_9HYPH|nr:hypothetical protein RHAB21_01147 [Pseudorhizobium halotolerans]